MNYQEALDFLQEAKNLGSKPGLMRLQKLLRLLNHPEEQLKFIHVAGTNGKGSTAMMLSSVLQCSGYRTGTFTSPYLTNVNEQIRVNGEIIDNGDFTKVLGTIKVEVDKMEKDEFPTEFELLTAAAFVYFNMRSCDIVVLETGMGGMLDATNVIPSPLIAVITNIGLDHTSYLGKTIEEIARHKAGIIKEHTKVVSYEQLPIVRDILEKRCQEMEASIVYADFSKIDVIEEHLTMQKFTYRESQNLSLPLIGEHQRCNAAVVLQTIEVLRKNGYSISDEHVKQGIFQVNWPARMEILAKRPLVILDGGHNEQCIDAVIKVLNNYVPNKKIIFVTGVMKDKDYMGIIKKLVPIAEKFITVRPDNDRALDAVSLARAIHEAGGEAVAESSVVDGIMTTLEDAKPSDVICIVGSLYMAGKVRECFMN